MMWQGYTRLYDPVRERDECGRSLGGLAEGAMKRSAVT